MRQAAVFAGAALALAIAVPAAAQLGAATSSPPPEGLEEGQGAGYPKGGYAALEELPDWGGIWFVEFRIGGGGSPPPQPQLKGEYLERLEQWRKDIVANNGLEPRPRGNCSPPGMPRIMMLGQYPYEFLFTPGRVTVNQEAWMQTRTIWTDGRRHPPLEELDPTFMGHSIGHWEGDTLVVDTIGILDELQIANGAYHSDQFRLTERIHLDPENHDVLVNEMRMEDPLAFAEPFEVTTRYKRDRNGALIEFQCNQNDRNPVDEDGHTIPF